MEWNNYKQNDAGNDKYGEERIKLAVFLRDSVFVHLQNTVFIENGTLLGAWRNSTFLAHDDDFDYGILIDSKIEISNILEVIRDRLPDNYSCRRVDSYADKIEIYEPSFGDYILAGPNYNNENYHYVTVDLQFYLKQNSDKYRWLYNIANSVSIGRSVIEPLGEILLEGEQFKCPNKIEEFLQIHYGYIGEDAEYSEDTKLYTKKI